jgi:hypothetical protein
MNIIVIMTTMIYMVIVIYNDDQRARGLPMDWSSSVFISG